MDSLDHASACGYQVCLVYDPCKGTCIHPLHHSQAHPVSAADLIKGWQQRLTKPTKGSNPLAKALGLSTLSKKAQIIDLTAGLARDAFTIASFGCEVSMIETSIPLVILLEEALAKIQQSKSESLTNDQDITRMPKLMEISARLKLIEGDHKLLIKNGIFNQLQPQAIYFDPMYPPSNKTAMVKKETQVLQGLANKAETSKITTHCMETQTGWWSHLGTFKGRLVIKRHIKAPVFFKHPTFTIKGSRVRFDVYQFN